MAKAEQDTKYDLISSGSIDELSVLSHLSDEDRKDVEARTRRFGDELGRQKIRDGNQRHSFRGCFLWMSLIWISVWLGLVATLFVVDAFNLYELDVDEWAWRIFIGSSFGPLWQLTNVMVKFLFAQEKVQQG